MLDEAGVEQASIRSLVEQLWDADPGDDMFDAKVKLRCEFVTHHVKEEGDRTKPSVEFGQCKTRGELLQLGKALVHHRPVTLRWIP